jgi:oligosaccharide repeat unit polymerase
VSYFLAPRFSQPWQRGQYGDLNALLTEIGALLYLVPPLAGVILGRVRRYSRGSRLLVFLGLVFTLFYGFSTGTRNIMVIFVVTFGLGYFFAEGGILTLRVKTTVFLAACLIGISAYYGVQFRNVGLGEFLLGTQEQTTDAAPTLFVDYNLFVISRLTNIFFYEHDYVGMAVPLWIVARPVPRVLWPGKPDGLEVSADTYLEVEGVSLTSTFVGESFMAAGFIGVAIGAICLGALARWWTVRAYSIHSDFAILVYSSGFFALVMSVRSLYQLPVAILPTLWALVYGRWFLRSSIGHAARVRRE